jgi:Ca-activated chloride channel family protein
MSLLTPAALALLALAVPILILWMLRLRRRSVTVSSTMLWTRLVRDREANAPWQRLRRNLLLFLQLAVLLALVLALARPFVPVPAVAGGVVVLLLDASASMNATDVPPSRFAVAQRAAEEMVEGLGGDGIMTVIAVGGQPHILAAATGDKTVLREAIAAAQVEQAPADWTPAFALAAGATSGAGESTIVIISDGNLPPDLPPLPGDVRYVPVGREEGAQNLAITALAARDGAVGTELFVNIANTGTPASGGGITDSLLSIYLDGTLYDSRRVEVAAGENRPLTLTGLPEEAALIEARLLVEDALALDNTAWAAKRPAGERRALLVSAGNLFLERAIAGLPEVNAFRSGPEAPLPAEPYDLVVLDGAMPAEPPEGPLLVINPPVGNPLLTVTGTFSDTQLSRVADSPLLAYVDFGQVQILEARKVDPPAWANVLVAARGGPLLLVGEPAGRRVAVLTFDLHQSDLPLQIAFPVLVANLVSWLTPGLPFDAGDGLRPGVVVTLFPGGADEVLVRRPDGSTWTPPAEMTFGEAPLVFAETEQLGLYQVEMDGTSAGHFPVNLFNPAESALARRESITVGRAEIAPAGGEELGQRELWPWLAAAALVVLLVEWWVYHRGTRSLKPKRP